MKNIMMAKNPTIMAMMNIIPTMSMVTVTMPITTMTDMTTVMILITAITDMDMATMHITTIADMDTDMMNIMTNTITVQLAPLQLQLLWSFPPWWIYKFFDSEIQTSLLQKKDAKLPSNQTSNNSESFYSL